MFNSEMLRISGDWKYISEQKQKQKILLQVGIKIKNILTYEFIWQSQSTADLF